MKERIEFIIGLVAVLATMALSLAACAQAPAAPTATAAAPAAVPTSAATSAVPAATPTAAAASPAAATIDLSTILLFGLIWFGIVTFLRLRKKKNLAYLLVFTIFYVYLYKVLDYTLFQFQSLLLLKHFMPDLILQGQTAGKNVNLIPLITLTLEDLITSLLNILLLIPFGFGLPFITNLRMKKIVIIGALFSVVIEFLQLVTGFIAEITFRIADINDVIFNTVGVAIGYILFVGFVRIYRHVSHNRKISANSILRHIAERPQIDKQR